MCYTRSSTLRGIRLVKYNWNKDDFKELVNPWTQNHFLQHEEIKWNLALENECSTPSVHIRLSTEEQRASPISSFHCKPSWVLCRQSKSSVCMMHRHSESHCFWKKCSCHLLSSFSDMNMSTLVGLWCDCWGTAEVSIRKLVGASTFQITRLMSPELLQSPSSTTMSFFLGPSQGTDKKRHYIADSQSM